MGNGAGDALVTLTPLANDIPVHDKPNPVLSELTYWTWDAKRNALNEATLHAFGIACSSDSPSCQAQVRLPATGLGFSGVIGCTGMSLTRTDRPMKTAVIRFGGTPPWRPENLWGSYTLNMSGNYNK